MQRRPKPQCQWQSKSKANADDNADLSCGQRAQAVFVSLARDLIRRETGCRGGKSDAGPEKRGESVDRLDEARVKEKCTHRRIRQMRTMRRGETTNTRDVYDIRRFCWLNDRQARPQTVEHPLKTKCRGSFLPRDFLVDGLFLPSFAGLALRLGRCSHLLITACRFSGWGIKQPFLAGFLAAPSALPRHHG